MALLKFLKGNYANLSNAAINEGQILVCGDTGELFVDVAADKRVKIGDFITVANLTALEALDATTVPTSRLYYVEDGNILARSNGTSWVQVNKQPTIAELKVQLGLGSMAYKSEVAEDDLNAALKEKVNAAAEGNHSHTNKTVLDGITAEKVTAWDAAEGNAKTYADGLNTAMNTRVEALEAIDHDHANKAELDLIATGDKAKWDSAAGKAHTHTFNETELNKIVEGDVAKWNGVAADHLTSADKTTLENSIKEAKKAGTDANTALESYKVTNDAAIDAIEEDIAEITDGTNGILAQAKGYSDGKLDAAKTAISAEIDADVKVVADDLAGYKTSNDTALAGVKATAEAAATKAYTDEELAKKVDKAEGKSLVSDTEIARLAAMKDGANKVEASETNGNIKIDGVETVVYTHPDKHSISDVTGLQDALDGKQAAGDYAAEVHTHVAADITNLDTTIKTYDYVTKAEAQGYANAKDDAIAAAKKAGDDAQVDVDALETYVGTIPTDEKYADITNVVAYVNKKAEETLAAAQGGSSETAASVKQQLDNYKSANDTRVKAAEDAIDAIEADYLKAADKTELQGKIDAKVASVTAGDASVTVGGTATAPTVAAKLSADADNALTLAEDGLKVVIPAAAEYSIVKAENSGDYAAVYNLTKDGTVVGASINIPKDMVVESGSVVENPEGQAAGTYIELKLQNVTDPLYINVGNLIEYVTSGSTAGDMVVINVSDDHKVTATITDGTITLAKLTTGIQTAIGKAHSHENATVLDGINADKVATWDAAEQNAKDYADGLNTAMDTRVKALEEIDHDAYIAADTALKTELQGEIDAEVKVVSDALAAYKTANDAEVAKKANSADVYAKTETYNKTEVDALFTWGEF